MSVEIKLENLLRKSVLLIILPFSDNVSNNLAELSGGVDFPRWRACSLSTMKKEELFTISSFLSWL